MTSIKFKSPFSLIFFVHLLYSLSLDCQTYILNNDTSILEVHGTSSLHDWHVDAQNQSGTITFNDINSADIKNLSFTVRAESLKSGKRGMDKNTYKALKTDKFKTIDFKLLSISNSQKLSQHEYKLFIVGKLRVSGVEKQIPVELRLKIDNNKILVEGEKSILMTDFDIEPPKALLGTIKTGNKIRIVFNSVFKF
ncbi:YceI family protein [Winogradskyella vincentii]|uniref:YceI family protein n=1 Tax=Winogradskyella vincentii TaxID=2877122 RepID=A0ABS7Y179_9FLAO|nr:YceI family protein [Winogradskyella vincentii]MCA0153351.1 YceI family protein [Winogradskyella vincentii]